MALSKGQLSAVVNAVRTGFTEDELRMFLLVHFNLRLEDYIRTTTGDWAANLVVQLEREGYITSFLQAMREYNPNLVDTVGLASDRDQSDVTLISDFEQSTASGKTPSLDNLIASIFVRGSVEPGDIARLALLINMTHLESDGELLEIKDGGSAQVHRSQITV